MSFDPYNIARSILQKISCFLSAAGSLMIISDLLRNKSHRGKVRQRLILGISLCDTLTSTTWFFTNLFMPPIGNQISCDVQGFFIQMGNNTNVLFMIALQIVYLLTIKYNWNETQIKKYEPHMVGFALFSGFGTGIAAWVMDLYNPSGWNCWITTYPSGCTQSFEINRGSSDLEATDCIRGDNAQIYQFAFFYAPLWAGVLFIIIVMCMIWKSVEKTERRSARKSFRSLESSLRSGRDIQGSTSQLQLVLTPKVKKQCILYAMGFFVVWSFPTLVRFIQIIGGKPPAVFTPLAAFFIGSQGLWNSMIYFRPKYSALTEEKYWWGKVWTLVRTNFLFCFECKENSKSEANDAIPARATSTGSDSVRPGARNSMEPGEGEKFVPIVEAERLNIGSMRSSKTVRIVIHEDEENQDVNENDV